MSLIATMYFNLRNNLNQLTPGIAVDKRSMAQVLTVHWFEFKFDIGYVLVRRLRFNRLPESRE